MIKVISALTLILYSLNLFADIGFNELEVKDKTRNRLLSTFIFYPSNDKTRETFAENMVFYGFSASKGASVSKAKLPLFFLAHGTSGNWKNTTWLAKELAENAIVVSANFPNYTSGQASPESVLKPWDQAKDISFLIDTILSSPYGQYIDQNKIVVIGHSLGGYTAMALSGAIIDLKKYYEFCKINIDKSCMYFKGALEKLTVSNIEEAKHSLYDKRVKVAIAIAPGFTESMTQNSLKNLKTPILIISVENDLNIPPKTHLSNIPQNIEQYQIKESSHFSFLQVCKPNAKIILAEEKAEFVCEDSGSKTRSDIHKEALKQIRLFLSKHDI